MWLSLLSPPPNQTLNFLMTLRKLLFRFWILGNSKSKSSSVRRLERCMSLARAMHFFEKSLSNFKVHFFQFTVYTTKKSWYLFIRLVWIWVKKYLTQNLFLDPTVYFHCNSKTGSRVNPWWPTNLRNSQGFSHLHERTHFSSTIHSWDSICKSC